MLFTILGILLLVSAYFSGSETGMMSLNRYRLRHLEKQKHKGAKRVSKLLDRPDRLIGLILIGNNLVNVFASRILGMGDVLSLVEEIEQKVDKKQAEKLAKKVKSGKGFSLEDFRDQLVQMKNMGGMMGMMDKLPGMGNMSDKIKDQMDDKVTVQMEAIINSMTPGERERPDIIKGSRKRRIAAGSGTQIQDVNKLLKQFTQMQKMMKKMSGKGGMKKMMRSMQGMMPPGGGMGGMGGGGMFGR